jgi:signal transduction histidine kinase/CheY-like chemotaxis protein
VIWRRAAEPALLGELVALHARVMLRMPVIAVLVVAAVAYENAAYVPGPVILAWGLVVVAIDGVRGLYARSLLRASPSIDPAVAHRRFVLLAALSGLAVGISGPLFFPSIPIENRTLLAQVFFAMTAGGVAASASSQAILAAYSLAMLAPGAAAWGIAQPSQALSACALSLLYCGFLVMMAGDGERLIARSLRIRRERDRVVQDLERRNADVQAAVAAAEQSAQARARVLAAASHDLRQPLHALSIYSAILNAKPDPDALPEVSRNIDQLVRALGNLLNGLLDLSRLSSGHFVPDRRAFSLDQVATDIAAEARSGIEEKGLTLVVDTEPVTVDSDPTAVGRVLRNLIDNASKYTDTGGIRIEVRRLGEHAVVAVEDTGKGIPPAEQTRIFEEFYQLDNAARDRSRGVGLGLAIVQRLCELLGAQVAVVSELGHGSRFSVSLPALASAGAEPSAVPGRGPVDRFSGQRVYLVDDEPEIQRSTSSLLRLWGLRVQAVGDSAQLDVLFDREGVPDLLIADLRLDEAEHGAAVADRLLRRHGRFGVLVVTGETASQALQHAHRLGFSVLHKPITPESLRASIRSALRVGVPHDDAAAG